MTELPDPNSFSAPSVEALEQLRKSASRFQIAMLIFLGITTLGTAYALWRSTQLLQALRSAQFEAAGIIKNGEASELVAFVKNAIDSWPERLALFEPGADAALRTTLAVVASFCFLFFLKHAPKGRDLEATAPVGSRKSDRLERAKRLANYGGNLFVRTDDQPSAVAYRNDIYLPAGLCQRLDRRLESHVAEKIGFVIVHERSHARSLDNALWSLGTINSLLIIAIVSMLLAQIGISAAIIVIPDAFVQITSHELTVGLACVMLAVALSLVAAAIAGVVANFTAAREYFADALAAATIGRQYLPYADADNPARIGTIVEPWRLGTADADRRLHVRGVFPRAGALMASGVALWAFVRSILLFGCGGYAWGQAIVDIAAVGCLCALLFLLPPRSSGARHYTVLPVVITFIAIGLLGGVPVAINAFAVRFGLLPLFSLSYLLNLMVPPLLLLSMLMAALILRRRVNPDLDDIERYRPRIAFVVPALFMLGAPAWMVSFVLAGLCIFTLANFVANMALGPGWPGSVSIFNLLIVFIFGLIAVLLAKNLKRPTPISMGIEIVLSLVTLLGVYYISSIMADVAAASGGVLRYDAITARMMSFDRSDFPSLPTAFSVCVVLLLSWYTRLHFKRWQTGVR